MGVNSIRGTRKARTFVVLRNKGSACRNGRRQVSTSSNSRSTASFRESGTLESYFAPVVRAVPETSTHPSEISSDIREDDQVVSPSHHEMQESKQIPILEPVEKGDRTCLAPQLPEAKKSCRRSLPPRPPIGITKGKIPKSTTGGTSSSVTRLESEYRRKRIRMMVSKRQQQPQQQMYLDFGQRDFAKHILCKICGMMYVHGVKEDVERHEAACRDFKEGVSLGRWARGRFRDVGGGEKIVEVRPGDSLSHQKKVQEVKRIVDQEMGFVQPSTAGVTDDNNDNESRPPPGRCRTAFLYVTQRNKVIGLCTTELISSAYSLLPSTSESELDCGENRGTGNQSLSHQQRTTSNFPTSKSHFTPTLVRSCTPTKVTLGIHQIWTHSAHRRMGIATRLLDAARDAVVYGTRVSADRIAFSSPTGDGVRLALSYIGGDTGDEGTKGKLEDIKVYDC